MSRPTERLGFADVGLLSPVWAGTTVESLTSDGAVAEAMTRFETALVGARAGVSVAGVSTPDVADPPTDVRDLALSAVGPGNPAIGLLEAIRAGLSEEQAQVVHHGATSQDVVDTALMLVADRSLVAAEADLETVAGRLAELASEHRDTPCVARTLTQQAMPTTLGFRIATWLAGVHDAVEAVRACRPLPVSLGGPVGTAAAYGAAGPDVVEALASSLGLGAPVISWHTRRTPVLTLAAALAAVGEACGRITADLLLMSQSEVDEVDEGSGGGSSAMAHKANPTQSVLVASAARQLPGLLATVVSAGFGSSERPAGDWHAEWQPLRTMLRLAGAAAERTAGIAERMSFDAEAMRRNLELLVSRVGERPDWVTEQTAHVDVWIERVLDRQQELFES
jgi:3-carboxy-cis,cis-muconate cycloisomerase